MLKDRLASVWCRLQKPGASETVRLCEITEFRLKAVLQTVCSIGLATVLARETVAIAVRLTKESVTFFSCLLAHSIRCLSRVG